MNDIHSFLFSCLFNTYILHKLRKFVKLQGSFPITSLTGHFIIHKSGRVNPYDSLNIIIRGSDGELFGGRVVESLIAATEIQVLYFLSFHGIIIFVLVSLVFNAIIAALPWQFPSRGLTRRAFTHVLGVGSGMFSWLCWFLDYIVVFSWVCSLLMLFFLACNS